MNRRAIQLVGGLTVLILGAVFAAAQDSPPDGTAESNTVDDVETAEEAPPPSHLRPEPERPADESAAEPEEWPSVRPAPDHRGEEMRAAFTGAGSRYGVSGRVLKLSAKPSGEKEEDAWRLKLELGLDTTRGNSDTLRYHGAAGATKETERNHMRVKLEGRYGESDDEKDTENATGEGKFQHKLSDWMYSVAEGQAKHDGMADLAYRLRGSISLGRHLVWTDRTVLSVEAGPGYVAERKGDEREHFLAGRVAQYLEFMVTPSLQVWQSVEYVPSLEDSRIWFVNAEIGLETVLAADLGLRVTVKDEYDSQPAEDKERNDLSTGTALTWTF